VLIVLLASVAFSCTQQNWVLASIECVLSFRTYGSKSNYFLPTRVTQCLNISTSTVLSSSSGIHTLHSRTCFTHLEYRYHCSFPKLTVGGDENEAKQHQDANLLFITQQLLWVREFQLQIFSLNKLYQARIQTFHLKVIILNFALHLRYRCSAIFFTILCLPVSYVT
jgi:hypothetical protein